MAESYELDILDETFIVADPAVVRAEITRPERWRQWWPDLRLEVTRDRGAKGMQWAVRGAVVGSMEIWLEPFRDGVVLHYFLRADPGGQPGRVGRRRRVRLQASRTLDWKRHVHALKDELEAGREPGASRPGWLPPAPVKDQSEPADPT